MLVLLAFFGAIMLFALVACYPRRALVIIGSLVALVLWGTHDILWKAPGEQWPCTAASDNPFSDDYDRCHPVAPNAAQVGDTSASAISSTGGAIASDPDPHKLDPAQVAAFFARGGFSAKATAAAAQLTPAQAAPQPLSG